MGNCKRTQTGQPEAYFSFNNLLLLCSAFAGAWGTEDLLFNVEVNLCCRAVLGYLLAVQFHL